MRTRAPATDKAATADSTGRRRGISRRDFLAGLGLTLLLHSCSPQQQDQARKHGEHAPTAQSEGARQPESAPRSETREAPLVSIAHFTSTRESVSTEELSQLRELAVARGSQQVAGNLLDRSGFETFDTTDAVIDHVS